MTKDKPKVSVVTEGGDWELQERARDLEKFLEGQFYECGLYEMGPALALDGGGIYGTGCLKFYIEGEGESARIRSMRVIPYELLVDEQEGLRGKPKNLMHQCWVDRLVLREMFKDDQTLVRAIEEAHQGQDTGMHGSMGYDSTADQLLVVEAWHLKSGPDAEDGRHCMVIAEHTLLDEPWPHEFFPFVFYRKQEAPLGFWGIGLAEELESIQTGLNRKLIRLEDSLRLLGAGHVLVHASSKLNFAKWDNQQGSQIIYSGMKPEIMVPPEVVPQQLVNAIETEYHRAFELTGIPEAQAQGGVPSNLETGKAQEIYLDVTDQRLQVAIHRYHDMFIEASAIILAFGREIVEHHNPKFGAKATMKKGGMRRVFLSEADMRDEEYVLKRWPTNGLADEPGARMGQVEKMANAGWLAPDEAKRLLDFPDLEAESDLENASYNAVQQIISEMLDEGRYQGPQPFLNLQQATRQVQLALIKAWADRRPEARLQLLRDWLNEAMSLPNGPGAPQQPQGMASAPGTPTAAAPAPGVTPAMQPPPGAGPPPAQAA